MLILPFPLSPPHARLNKLLRWRNRSRVRGHVNCAEAFPVGAAEGGRFADAGSCRGSWWAWLREDARLPRANGHDSTSSFFPRCPATPVLLSPAETSLSPASSGPPALPRDVHRAPVHRAPQYLTASLHGVKYLYLSPYFSLTVVTWGDGALPFSTKLPIAGLSSLPAWGRVVPLNMRRNVTS